MGNNCRSIIADYINGTIEIGNRGNGVSSGLDIDGIADRAVVDATLEVVIIKVLRNG